MVIQIDRSQKQAIFKVKLHKNKLILKGNFTKNKLFLKETKKS